jgi:hypothetical protein
MDNDKAFILHQSQRDQPDLAIIRPIVDPRQNIPLEYLRGIEDIDTMLPNDLFSLVFVPFKKHPTSSSC